MEEVKYQGQFIKVTEEKIGENIWERAYLHSGVMIYPVTKEGKIIMIEEKRPHETSKLRLKFVTGLLDKEGEDPKYTANRELQEEVGLKSQKLTLLLNRRSSGTLNNNLYLYIAEDLIPSKIPNPDGEDTIVSIKEFTIDEIFNMLDNNVLEWNFGILGLVKIKEDIKSGKLSLKLA